MLNQAFSPRALLRMVKPEDVARYRMWGAGDDPLEIMSRIASQVNSPEFEFQTLQEKYIKNKLFYSAPDATTMLVLRKLNNNICAIYKVKQANRDSIVHQVKSLLQETCEFTVLRLDIQSFYESIKRDELLARIERDSLLSYISRILLRKLFNTPQLARHAGLPRGLSISATLAELYVRSLDHRIKSLRHVYFYGRYVDDIIIFTHAADHEAEKDVIDALNEIGLVPNPTKKSVVKCSGERKPNDITIESIDFLGYCLECRRYPSDTRGWREITVKISSSKIKKIKSRIVHAFIDYVAVQNFSLLVRRLRFLAGNYVLRRSGNGSLCGGIYYNYHHITDLNALDNLDDFMHGLVFSRRGSIGRRLSPLLSNSQRRQIIRIRFRVAFEKRFTTRIPWGTMTNLRRCWAYEKN